MSTKSWIDSQTGAGNVVSWRSGSDHWNCWREGTVPRRRLWAVCAEVPARCWVRSTLPRRRAQLQVCAAALCCVKQGQLGPQWQPPWVANFEERVYWLR